MASLIIQGVVGVGVASFLDCRRGCISASHNFTEQSTFRVVTAPCLVYNPSRNTRRRKVRSSRAEAGQGLQSAALNLTKTIQTDSLPPAVRDSTMRAIDDLGRRVTNGDVAARTGLKVTQAESALQALAADSAGFLEVSDEGDVLYVFPKDYRSNLATKSLRLRVEPVVNKIQNAGAYLIRISFGTALVASIVLVYTTMIIEGTAGVMEISDTTAAG